MGSQSPLYPPTPAIPWEGWALTVVGRMDLRMRSRDALAWSGRVVIFSLREPVEAFQRLFNI